jgi:hypothetical protein
MANSKSTSTLDPDQLPVSPRKRKPVEGHDTRTLGPSDTSDSGSDMAGPGLVNDDAIGLDRDTNEDTETGSYASDDAGPSVGDKDMDSDSDRIGTGEHLTAGKDPNIRTDSDRDTDRVVAANDAGLGGGLDEAEEAQQAPRTRRKAKGKRGKS